VVDPSLEGDRDSGVLGLIACHVVARDLVLKDHFDEVAALMHKYLDVPMSVADGCLVRRSELWKTCTVLTLDSDCRIYPRHKRQRIPLLVPPDL
jgi:uncharacterized protein